MAPGQFFCPMVRSSNPVDVCLSENKTGISASGNQSKEGAGKSRIQGCLDRHRPVRTFGGSGAGRDAPADGGRSICAVMCGLSSSRS